MRPPHQGAGGPAPQAKPTTADAVLKRATTFRGLAVIALALMGSGAYGLKAWMSKADASTVASVETRLDAHDLKFVKQDSKIEVVEQLQRASFDQGKQTQDMLVQILVSSGLRVSTPKPVATPAPTPRPTPQPTAIVTPDP